MLHILFLQHLQHSQAEGDVCYGDAGGSVWKLWSFRDLWNGWGGGATEGGFSTALNGQILAKLGTTFLSKESIILAMGVKLNSFVLVIFVVTACDQLVY